MVNTHLKLVTPSIVNRTVIPKRLPNADLRTREHLTEAEVEQLLSVVQNVVTYTAIISAPNPDLLLLPGMTAQLRIVVSDTGDTLKIPSQALRFRPNGVGLAADRQNANQAASSQASATVWLVGEDGRPKPTAVRLGASDDNSTALLEGRLSEGQQLIVGVANSQKQRGYFGLRLGF